jgi:hypothetical protein
MKVLNRLWVICVLPIIFFTGCVSQPPYSGSQCLSGDCFNGNSTLRFVASGTQVTGDFEYGYPQGPVTVSKSNGDSYQGNMNIGIFQGLVSMNSAQGNQQLTYRWGVPQNLKHQRGRDLYTGTFNTDELGLVNVLEYSQGTYKTSKGSTYIGNFSYNGRNYTFDGLATFGKNKTSKGQFVSRDVSSNDAPLTFVPRGAHYAVIANKDYYQQYNDQGQKIVQRPGPKTIAYTHKHSGCRLNEYGDGWFIWKKGGCQGGLLSGQSTLYSSDGGKVLTGVFATGEIVKGKFTGGDGKTITGSWKNFMPHGNAHEKIAANNQYKGSYRFGVRHGHGLCTGPERKEKCEYDEGTRIDQVYVMRIENEKRRVAEEQRRKEEAKRRAAAAAANGGKDTSSWPVECVKKLAAIKACEQIGGWGETICKMTANGTFSDCKIPM